MGYVYKSYLDPQLGIPLGSTISQLSIPSNPKIKSCVSNTLSRILSINLACLYTHKTNNMIRKKKKKNKMPTLVPEPGEFVQPVRFGSEPFQHY